VGSGGTVLTGQNRRTVGSGGMVLTGQNRRTMAVLVSAQRCASNFADGLDWPGIDTGTA
jgi:hypothetical protein